MNPVAPRLGSSLGSAGRTFVRRRAAQVFLDKPVSADGLAANIAFGAAVLGAKHIELTHDGAWQFVASDFDWLRAPDGEEASVARLFERITPFPQQGPGSHRSEIYVAAFARHAYVARDGEVLWVVMVMAMMMTMMMMMTMTMMVMVMVMAQRGVFVSPF